MSDIIQETFNLLIEKVLVLATAESCTGGKIAAAITDFAGSSAIFGHGFVTYSNDAKQDMLGVQSKTLEQHGAVSEEVAREMAQGALYKAESNIAISVTGVAGPDGGTEEKPVGMICFGMAADYGFVQSETQYFDPQSSREEIRQQTVEHALRMVRDYALSLP